MVAIRHFCVQRPKLVAAAFGFALVAGVAPASSQTPPSPREIAAYDGVHRAAHDGDIAVLRRSIADGADLESRDRNGRTPLIVAAFASQEEAVAVLAEAGADVNALDADRVAVYFVSGG